MVPLPPSLRSGILSPVEATTGLCGQKSGKQLEPSQLPTILAVGPIGERAYR